MNEQCYILQYLFITITVLILCSRHAQHFTQQHSFYEKLFRKQTLVSKFCKETKKTALRDVKPMSAGWNVNSQKSHKRHGSDQKLRAESEFVFIFHPALLTNSHSRSTCLCHYFVKLIFLHSSLPCWAKWVSTLQ